MKPMLLLLITIASLFAANNPPSVVIVAPAAGATFKWNTPIRYEIQVSDKEDGDSRYDEINTKEVLMEVRYLNDSSQLSGLQGKRIPLQAMMASNCMNCHAFDARLIGPSFKEISEVYRDDTLKVAQLVQHVREGSRGVWGDVVMPTHPELSMSETEEMVRWILEYATDSTVSYFTGTTGVVRLPKPSSATDRGFLFMTASYRDHNLAVGEDSLLLPVAD
jgi:cytochrome c